MTAGDRTCWPPKWFCSPHFSFLAVYLHTPLLTEHPLLGRTTAAGLAFISADYRLLPPSTGHDRLEDIVDLFTFLGCTPTLGSIHLDASRLAVAGSSTGGMCAFLAAIHAKPRPRAVLSLYGLGGEVLVSALSAMRRLARLTLLPPLRTADPTLPLS